MTYYRSYFEKNNTIIKNSEANTARNPTTEIFYGSNISRFIFKIDFTDLIEKINNGDLVLDENTKHYLHLTNTIFGDETFKGAIRGTSRERATSFDLILFKIDNEWDEGVGFNYQETIREYDYGNRTFDRRPSNWFNRTTLEQWSTQGIYEDNPDIIGRIHFDKGDENIRFDLTDYVNDILLGNIVDNGLGLAFDVPFELLNLTFDQSVAFFTKYTQTFFEPFVESIFDNNVVDNRFDFIEKMNQNLYLYVTKGTNFYDLDELPIVDILDPQKQIITGLEDLTVTKVKKGIYKVTFGIDGLICDGKRFFYDVWKNIIIDGINLDDVTQKFIPKPLTTKFNIGGNDIMLNRYSLQFFGIKLNEQIKIGDRRKITVNFRSINEPTPIVFDEVYYKMFIYEGKTEVIIHDWTLLDKTNENSFVLDTSIYIPREYFISFKAKTHTEEIIYHQNINFEIISEK